MVLRTLINFASTGKRVPLIKFRKGGNAVAATSNQASLSQSFPAAPIANQAPTYTAHSIEDWELPPRYWRKPIDPVEIDFINRGGPA